MVKHFATRHNLTVEPTEYIECAKTFVEKVQLRTPKIKHLLLNVDELVDFRKKKISLWKNTRAHKGIRDTHAWKNQPKADGDCTVYTARTCGHEWKLVK